MPKPRTGRRRTNTAVPAVATLYALVTLAVLGGAIAVLVWLIAELF